MGVGEMSGRWFRFYDETLNDPKALKLSDKTYRIWVGILCIASKNDGALPPFEDMAIMLRMKPAKLQPELEKLIAAELIDHDDDGLRPHNWNTRQYKSDVSTERVKRFRNGDETFQKRPQSTESDTEQNRTEKKKEAHASRGAALPEDWRPSDEDFSYVENLGFTKSQALEGFEEMQLWAGANSNRSVGRKADWSKTYRGWMRRNRKRGNSNGQTPRDRSRDNFRTALDQLRNFGKGEVGGDDGGQPVRLLPAARSG
jgi:hypothetical protein